MKGLSLAAIFLLLRCVLVSALPSKLLHIDHSRFRNSTINVGATVCFNEGRGLSLVTTADCRGAVNEIFRSPTVMDEKHWSAAATRDIVMQRWDYRGCLIELIAVSPNSEDTFSEWTVAQDANQIIEDCVIDGPKLGGRRWINTNRRFVVILWSNLRGPLKSSSTRVLDLRETGV